MYLEQIKLKSQKNTHFRILFNKLTKCLQCLEENNSFTLFKQIGLQTAEILILKLMKTWIE